MNSGEASAMYIITADSGNTIWKTTVTKSTFSRNTGSTIIDLGDTRVMSSLEISESTFTENEGTCLSSTYGSITDTKSSYKNNEGSDGIALNLGEHT